MTPKYLSVNMNRFSGETDFFHGKTECTGILLVNLGTPDRPDKKSVRRYLREFLSDPRVVEIPRLLWLPLLYGFILTTRPAKSATAYTRIWQQTGSPLLDYSAKLSKQLEREMQIRFAGKIQVELGMRYGNPSIESALDKLRLHGAKRILVFPLYPQYSGTTTATTIDQVNKIMRKWRWIPELRFINQYYDHPAYIHALSQRVKQFSKKQKASRLLLFSFHGLPQRNLQLGDPYFCQCQKTARLLAKKLHLKQSEWKISFQSRFGKAQWLKPYTSEVLKEFPKNNIGKIQVMCPGFPVDCLETLDEINIENRKYFTEAGGKDFNYIPALNDSDEHVKMLADIAQQHTQGWPEINHPWDMKKVQKMAERAKKLGENH